MPEHQSWELLRDQLDTRQDFHVRTNTTTTTTTTKTRKVAGKSDTRDELILCTLCNSIILLSRLADHFRLRHNHLSSVDLCQSCPHQERSLSSNHATKLEPSDTYHQECFPHGWNHEGTAGGLQSLRAFSSANEASNLDIPLETGQGQADATAEAGKLEADSSATDFFDFYDLFPDTSELYDDTANLNCNDINQDTSLTTTTTNNNNISNHGNGSSQEMSFMESNVYLNDFLHSSQANELSIGNGGGIPSEKLSVSKMAPPTRTQTYFHNESTESYLTVGRSETSDGQSHTLETPSPDFFTLPSASSSSTYSVDSSVFNNNSEAPPTQCLSTCYPDQSMYGVKSYEIKSPPTSMPILVRFNNTTPARMHGENDGEVEQAVASIVDLDEKKDEAKASGGDEKLPILSPINPLPAGGLQETQVPDNQWGVESSTVNSGGGGGGGGADIDWELWDSLELTSSDYVNGDMSGQLPLLKANDLISSLEPYDQQVPQQPQQPQGQYELEACQFSQSEHEQHQQQQQPQQMVLQEQTMYTLEQPQILLPVATTTIDQPQQIQLAQPLQNVVPVVTTSTGITTTTAPTASTTSESKPKPEGSSSSRSSKRGVDCMNGSLPLHLWPFDPRLHCGVQRDGTVCRRSLLCKLHSMGLKRQVERPQDIGILVKQLREAKRLKKLTYPKNENSTETSTNDRRNGSSSAFILPNTGDPNRNKLEHQVFISAGGATPIRPALETSVAQTTPGPALVRCAYTGNQLQIAATGIIATGPQQQHPQTHHQHHGGAGTLQIVEKPLQIQPATFQQAAGGGLTVISDGIQAQSIRCDQSIFAHRGGGTAGASYLQFDQSGASSHGGAPTTFLNNRQLCAVIGVAQKTLPQFDPSTTAVPTGATVNGGYLTLNPTAPATTQHPVPTTTQAATIIVGHPDGGTSGTVQYANDKVDSINLLSPSAGPGCISLPPRSARVFQLILPQSATALSLRPHPGSMGSVIQLTTTGSNANLGSATIPLKQNAMVGLEQAKTLEDVAVSIQEASASTTTTTSTTTVEQQQQINGGSAGEMTEGHKTLQADSSSLLTLAEWDQLHKNGSILIPTSRGINYTEIDSSTNGMDVTGELQTTSTTNLYDIDGKVEDDTSSWMDFATSNTAAAATPTTNTKDTTKTTNGTFLEPLPPSGDGEASGEKKNSSSNPHSKLRVLLFDMEDEDEDGVEGAPTGEPGDTESESMRSTDAIQTTKSTEGRVFKTCSTVGTTTNLPTAIVAPTAFSMSTTTTTTGESGSQSNSPAVCCSADEGSKDKPGTPGVPGTKKRRLSPSGADSGFTTSSGSNSASPLKQKKCDDTNASSSSSCSSTSSPSTSSNVARISSGGGTQTTTPTTNVAATGTILSLQPATNRIPAAQHVESITLPVTSAMNCGGNIIICSNQQPAQQQHAWNCQLKSLDNRPAPLTLVRLPNGQLAAVPSSVFSGGPTAQVTLAPAAPPPPPPPPQQPILQSHGTTLVLRYPQQATQTGLKASADATASFDPTQTATAVVDAATGANLTIVNGNYQFQHAPQFQQQRLVMLSAGGKATACYATACDHLNDPGSNPSNGGSGANGAGDQVGASAQTANLAPAFQQQQASATLQHAQQIQQPPAGAMTVLVRGANSTSSLQFLIPQPDGTMVLQPATLQNQFCSRAAATAGSNVSLLQASTAAVTTGATITTQQQSQPQQQQQQQNTTGVFSQQMLQTAGYISLPRADDTTSIFHAPNAGICTNGQFTAADDASANSASASAAANSAGSGFIEVVDASRSILSTTGDLSKWIQGGQNGTKVLAGRTSTGQQIFHQQACLDSTNSTIIQLSQTTNRASISQQQTQQQQQQQQVVFLTTPAQNGNGVTNSGTGNGSQPATFTTYVQQTSSLDPNRGVWTATSTASGGASGGPIQATAQNQ